MTTIDHTTRIRKSAESARTTAARRVRAARAEGQDKFDAALERTASERQLDRPAGFTGSFGWLHRDNKLIDSDWFTMHPEAAAHARDMFRIEVRADGTTALA